MREFSERTEPDERGTPPNREVVDALVQLSEEERAGVAGRGSQVTRLVTAVGRSSREAGTSALVRGRWLADVMVEVAPRLGVRDVPALRRQYPGLPDEAIADALVATATRATMAIGAAVGVAVTAEWGLPALLLTTPIQLAAETLAVAVVEIKLIAELHAIYGAVPPGAPQQRALAYAGAWSQSRGIDPLNPVSMSLALGAISKGQLRKQLLRRMGRSLPSLAPMLAGAIAGGWVNRIDTRKLAARIRDDLRRKPVPFRA